MSIPVQRPGPSQPHTIEQWQSLPADQHVELLDGALVRKAAPSAEHSLAQVAVDRQIGASFHRKPADGSALGGWWILGEVDLSLGSNGFRPDLVGWRRARVPVMPSGSPVTLVPDWVFEVVSASNASNDLVYKRRRYAEAGIPHYWIADPRDRILYVNRLTPDGYLTVIAATAGETVRPEPFGAVELRIGTLFGEEPDESPIAPAVPEDEPQDG